MIITNVSAALVGIILRLLTALTVAEAALRSTGLENMARRLS